MKKETVLEMFKFLGNIKLNKFPKELRTPILLNHVSLNKIVKEFNVEVEDMQKKMFEGKEKDVQKLINYREELINEKDNSKKTEIVEKIKTECLDALILEQELNNIYYKKLQETVDLKIEKLPLNSFIEACSDNDIDVTPDILIKLEELFKNE